MGKPSLVADFKEYTVQVWANGDKYWYQNDKLHREDGPACELAYGNKRWYQNGKLHREDGPAVEYANGAKYWYLNGKLHREDGPACEYANGQDLVPERQASPRRWPGYRAC